MRFVIAFMLSAAAFGQQLSIHIGNKSWAFDAPAAPANSIVSLICDKTALSPGVSSSCTINLNVPAAAGGFLINPFTADSPLVLSPSSITVPAGSQQATFTVTWPPQ